MSIWSFSYFFPSVVTSDGSQPLFDVLFLLCLCLKIFLSLFLANQTTDTDVKFVKSEASARLEWQCKIMTIRTERSSLSIFCCCCCFWLFVVVLLTHMRWRQVKRNNVSFTLHLHLFHIRIGVGVKSKCKKSPNTPVPCNLSIFFSLVF